MADGPWVDVSVMVGPTWKDPTVVLIEGVDITRAVRDVQFRVDSDGMATMELCLFVRITPLDAARISELRSIRQDLAENPLQTDV